MFAAGKSANGGSLITRTFTSNTTWTAPATTGSVLTMSGYGGPATADAYNSNKYLGLFGAVGVSATGYPNAPYAQWATVYGYLNDAIAVATASNTTRLAAFAPYSAQYAIGTDDTWQLVTSSGSVWLTSNTYTSTPYRSPQTSGNITYSSIVSGGNTASDWQLSAPGYDLGGNGTAATGLGKTFPGGTLSGSEPYRTTVPATTTTFTNVVVTPGATYSIVVPSGGSLTITYIG